MKFLDKLSCTKAAIQDICTLSTINLMPKTNKKANLNHWWFNLLLIGWSLLCVQLSQCTKLATDHNLTTFNDKYSYKHSPVSANSIPQVASGLFQGQSTVVELNYKQINSDIDLKKHHCKHPPSAINAGSNLGNHSVKTSKYSLDTEVNYSCKLGHEKISGNELLKCVIKEGIAQWDNDPLVCEIINCKDPGEVEHAIREGSSFKYKSQVSYKCNPGYQPSGPPFLICGPDGTWNRKKPVCKVIQCPHLPKLGPNLFSQYSDTERLVNSTVSFQCKDGYHIDNMDNSFRTCQWDGKWSGENPTCVQNFCEVPANLNPGVRLLPKRKKYLTGETIHCYCTINNEDSKVECLPDGTLKGLLENCPLPKKTHCASIDIPHGQFVSSAPDHFTLGAKLTFKCDYNYMLSDQRWIICQHNGEWTNKPPRCIDLASVKTSQILSYILSCIIVIIIMIAIITIVLVFRWRQKQIQRRQWQRYFCNYEYQHDKSYMRANSSQEMKLFFQSKRLSVPFTDL